jgi:bloom syndrome protein
LEVGELTAHAAFGHSEYKGKQKEIIEAAIQGCDVFVLAPTGMGKSICFQVPAMADKVRVSIYSVETQT